MADLGNFEPRATPAATQGSVRRYILTGSVIAAQVGGLFWMKPGGVWQNYPSLSRVPFCFADTSHGITRLVDGYHTVEGNGGGGWYLQHARVSWPCSKVVGLGLVLNGATLTTEELTLVLERLPYGGAWIPIGEVTVTASTAGLAAYAEIDHAIVHRDRYALRMDVVDYPSASAFRADLVIKE